MDHELSFGRIFSLAAGAACLAAVCIFALFGWAIVPAGHAGVHVRLGKVKQVSLGEGFYFKAPLITSIKDVDTRTQKIEVSADGASKDLQDVQTTIALNYHVNPSLAHSLYQKIGRDYRDRIIAPAIEESLKSATALFTAEELITKRAQVKQEAKRIIRERLENNYMVLDDFSIVNFQFSQAFDTAIEAKVTAEQEALAQKNKLESVKFQAQQKIETAKAEAEAIRIRAAALANNAKLVELEAVQRWNGVMPQYMLGDSVPFLSIK